MEYDIQEQASWYKLIMICPYIYIYIQKMIWIVQNDAIQILI